MEGGEKVYAVPARPRRGAAGPGAGVGSRPPGAIPRELLYPLPRPHGVLGLLLLLFVVTPLVEIWLLLRVSEVVGVTPTVALVLVTGLVGGAVARWQGTRAVREIVDAASQGRAPGRELAAGALFVAGAAFLLTPGIVTDVAGFLLMIPPVRLRAAGVLVSRMEASPNVHVHVGGPAAGSWPGPGFGAGGRGPEEGPKRVDAEARVVDPDDEDA